MNHICVHKIALYHVPQTTAFCPLLPSSVRKTPSPSGWNAYIQFIILVCESCFTKDNMMSCAWFIFRESLVVCVSQSNGCGVCENNATAMRMITNYSYDNYGNYVPTLLDAVHCFSLWYYCRERYGQMPELRGSGGQVARTSLLEPTWTNLLNQWTKRRR